MSIRIQLLTNMLKVAKVHNSKLLLKICVPPLLVVKTKSRFVAKCCSESLVRNGNEWNKHGTRIKDQSWIITRLMRWIKRIIIHCYWICRRVSLLILCSFPVPLVYTLSHLSKHELYLKYILLCIRLNGPAFIKLGQWAATRRDVFSKQFCDILGQLHTQAYTHKFSHTEKCLRESLGENYHSRLTFIESKPVGSGCVAQVHRASYIKANGSHVSVAIKVLHPSIVDEINTDVWIMEKLVSLALIVKPSLKWVDPLKALRQFKQVINQQLDFSVEAANLREFSNNFEKDHEIIFPEVYFASNDVIIESFESGPSMNEFVMKSSWNTSQEIKTRIAKMGINALLKMIFIDNFVHGDLHPGNMIIKTNQQTNEDYNQHFLERSLTKFMALFNRKPKLPEHQLVFIDAGMATRLTDKDLHNFKSVFKAIVLGKGEEVGDLMLEHSPNQSCTDPKKFRSEVKTLVDSVTNVNIVLNRVNVSAILSDLFTVLSTHRIQMDATFTCVVLSVIVLEGLGRFLDPQLNLLKCATPYVLAV